jgi:hypothetical protein
MIGSIALVDVAVDEGLDMGKDVLKEHSLAKARSTRRNASCNILVCNVGCELMNFASMPGSVYVGRQQ